MSHVRQLLTEDNGRWSLNVADWSKLNNNATGCRLSSPHVKHLNEGPGFESLMWDRGCALMSSPIQGQKRHQALLDFQ